MFLIKPFKIIMSLLGGTHLAVKWAVYETNDYFLSTFTAPLCPILFLKETK